MNEVPMFYFSQGEFTNALLWVMNNYMPYGIFWFLYGLVLFTVVYQKSRSSAISGFVFSMFLSIINVMLPVIVQAYFAVVAAVMLFMVIYRVLR